MTPPFNKAANCLVESYDCVFQTVTLKRFSQIVTVSFMLFRYRKQMEEMQRAFNKTIIKLQNTSRIAEEQVS